MFTDVTDTFACSVLRGLRDVLSLLWMLQCRDKLSLALRKKTKIASKKVHTDPNSRAVDKSNEFRQ